MIFATWYYCKLLPLLQIATMSAGKAKRACQKCGKVFAKSQGLQRHMKRLTPCTPVLDPEDLPAEKRASPNKCKFCGRVYSTSTNMLQHIKNSCKIAPRDGDTSGMEKLYEHTLRKQLEEQQKEMRAMKEQIATLTASSTQLVAGGAKATPLRAEDNRVANVMAETAVVDQSTKNSVTINIFGKEDKAHITRQDVWEILRNASGEAAVLEKEAEAAILRAAMLIFSDEKRPENITCYMPNKKGKEALIRGKSGWEVRPVATVLPPMMKSSVYTQFDKQTLPGKDVL
jgi:hypothetical protein